MGKCLSADAEIVLSEAALFVAAHGDGEHTLEDLRNNFAKRYGKGLTADEVQAVFDRLDAACMLETEAFRAERERHHRTFLEAPQRAPAHAGVSYPEEAEAAREAVRGFFATAAALEEPGERPAGTLRGLVAPHIDLRVGGPATALAYRLIAEAPQVETVVVLGTSHGCPHPAWIVTEKAYETPLGIVPTEAELCRRLAASAGAAPEDIFYHRKEHSIEFQALFLAALREEGRNLRMVPVLCGSIREDENPPASNAFLTELETVLGERGESMVLLAGADLAHVGPRFGDPESLSPEHLGQLERKDRATLETVAQGSAPAFLASVLEAGDPRRICGLAPIYGLLAALPGTRGKLLRYEQATDPTGTVSYASLGLWSEPGVTPPGATPPERSAG
jgi:AmmeMemoRadiSam system protein B